MQVELTTGQLITLESLLDEKIATLHNHIASAIEGGWVGLNSPDNLVHKLRHVESIATSIRRQLQEQSK